MYKPILLFLLKTAAAIGADSSPQLLRRQIVSQLPCSSQGQKDCGAVCIDLSHTCCPDRASGCPVGTYCSLGSNGEYGCCQNGRTCAGPGGAFTSPGGTITSTQTILVPGETSTQTESTTSTLEPTETEPADTSVSTSTSASVSTYSPPSANLTTTNPAATTSLPEFTGAADSNIQGFLPVKLLAIVLPFFAI